MSSYAFLMVWNLFSVLSDLTHGDNPAGVRAVLQPAIACDIGTNIPHDSKSVYRLIDLPYRDCQQHGRYVGPEIRSCDFHKRVWMRIRSHIGNGS